MPSKVEFVQTPLTVLEADMPPMHKVGFQFLLYRCWRDHCNFIRGSYRALAKQLHIAKTSFIARVLPAWIKAGWITVQEIGKELIITLCREAITVPPRDKSVPQLSSNLPVISNSTDIITNLLTEVSSNVSSLTVPPRDTVLSVPLLTPELVLQLSSQILPVPPRPAGGQALERWMKSWYTAAEGLIADFAPVSGPLAWREMDEVIQFTASPESGWMKKIGRSPTLENIHNTLHIQREQMARLGAWQPEKRTPYPGVPQWDSQEDAQPFTEQVSEEELNALVASLLAPTQQEEPVPTWDDRQEEQLIRKSLPFATKEDLLDYADLLVQGNPELQLILVPAPECGVRLLAQCGPDDQYIGIDAEIWEHPTPGEEALIEQAISYGRSCMQEERQAVTI